MPLVYDDEPDAAAIEEMGEDTDELGQFRRLFSRGRRRWGIRGKIPRPVGRPARPRPVKKVKKVAKVITRPVPVEDLPATAAQRARIARMRARGVKVLTRRTTRRRIYIPRRRLAVARQRQVQQRQISRCKNLLKRHGMMSDYLQVGALDIAPPSNDLGAFDLFGRLATAIGIRDPISHYEPGMSLVDVWKKYSSRILSYPDRVARIRSAKARTRMTGKLGSLLSARARIAPAFVAGAKPGARDRDRLASLVQDERTFRKAIHAAEREVGVSAKPEIVPPVGAEPVVTTVVPPILEEAPNYLLYGGLAALALALVLGRRKAS